MRDFIVGIAFGVVLSIGLMFTWIMDDNTILINGFEWKCVNTNNKSMCDRYEKIKQ